MEHVPIVKELSLIFAHNCEKYFAHTKRGGRVGEGGGLQRKKSQLSKMTWVNYVIIVFLQNQGYSGQSGEKDACG